jgi:hypothetical protein
MTENITKLSEYSRLDLVSSRRKEIKERMAAIQQQQTALTQEHNAMWHEDQELARAEVTIKKLMAQRNHEIPQG